VDHAAICIAILLWLVRPQDWMTGFAGVGFMKYAMLAAVFGLWSRPRSEGFGLFKSPSDYAVTAYLFWIILTTGDYFETAKEVLPFGVFYFATALSLNSLSRLRVFLNCWTAGLATVVIFALSTHFGNEFAPGSLNLTEMFDGRLTLNTWIFNNPNSLGHGVVALIPLGYVWLWWKRPLLLKLVALAVIYAAGYCAFLTQSKGAYLCGFAALGMIMLFRRRLVVQACLVLLAMTSGIAALKLLPRMDTMSAQEDGIAGRLVIWQMAHNAMENTETGDGWKKFEAWVNIPKIGHVKKATHGSYVNVGADLGYPGLFLFVAVLYCSARVLFQAKPPPEDLEAGRIQRALLSLLCSYSASAWVIDRAYHTDFFFIAGAVAAFHRLSTAAVQREGEPDGSVADEPSTLSPALVPLPSLALVQGGGGAGLGGLRLSVAPALAKSSSPGGAGHGHGQDAALPAPVAWLPWKKIGVVDVLLIYVSFQAVLYVWEEIMTHFISF
jgi:hypothetical protein